MRQDLRYSFPKWLKRVPCGVGISKAFATTILLPSSLRGPDKACCRGSSSLSQTANLVKVKAPAANEPEPLTVVLPSVVTRNGLSCDRPIFRATNRNDKGLDLLSFRQGQGENAILIVGADVVGVYGCRHRYAAHEPSETAFP